MRTRFFFIVIGAALLTSALFSAIRSWNDYPPTKIMRGIHAPNDPLSWENRIYWPKCEAGMVEMGGSTHNCVKPWWEDKSSLVGGGASLAYPRRKCLEWAVEPLGDSEIKIVCKRETLRVPAAAVVKHK